jgi:hypothetical protein
MSTDIVIPNGNEQAFIEMAKRLGYRQLIFLYRQPKDISSDFPVQVARLGIKRGVHKCFALAKENSRDLFESREAFCIFGLEKRSRADFIHHRNSGLNQVLCRLAKERGIRIGFSFSTYLHGRRRDILGRMMQNARLCRKYGLETIAASFATSPYDMRSPADMESFSRIVGINPIVKFK